MVDLAADGLLVVIAPNGILVIEFVLAHGESADTHNKFKARKTEHWLIVVLAVDPSLLYIIGNP